MVFNRWKKGDILFIDNFSVSHGRQPTYDTGRKVVVGWDHPLKKLNRLNSSTAITTNVLPAATIGENNKQSPVKNKD
jgi:hypothetical protein